MEQFREDIREIKSDLKELIKQGAEHNALLKEHEARSLALQYQIEKEKAERTLLVARLQPVEAHKNFMTAVFKWGGALLAAIILQTVIKLIF